MNRQSASSRWTDWSMQSLVRKRYAAERNDGERFGDFAIRIGMIKPTLEGKVFHEDVS